MCLGHAATAIIVTEHGYLPQSMKPQITEEQLHTA